jgi:phosphomannomutase
MTLRETLAVEPRELTFGTSGLRGLVADLSQLEVAINTQGFLRFLLEQGRIHAGDAVCFAGDLRPSTGDRVEVEGRPRGQILQAVAYAIREAGLRPVYLGRIPTPALMFYAVRHGLASVMVTGSHIPFDRNGIKLNKPDGEVLKADEPGILARVRQTRQREYDRPAEASPFGPNAMLRKSQSPDLPSVQAIGRDAFLDRYVAAFPGGVLQGRRILVYQHSAVGRDLLLELLQQLGAEAIPAGRSDRFVPIDT